MTPTRRTSCVAIHLCCSMALFSIGLSACNPVRLGATLRTGFGRPVQSTEATFTLPSKVAIHIEEDPFDSSAHGIRGCGVRAARGNAKSCLIRWPAGVRLS